MTNVSKFAGCGVLIAILASAAALAHDPAKDDTAAPRISMTDAVARTIVRRAIVGAAARLKTAECQRVLADFEDGQGRSLQANLEASGHSATSYLLGHVSFADDSEATQCRRRQLVAAFTAPGDTLIRICTPAFANTASMDTAAAEVLVIHEMLHTLGLDENPPSPEDITRRIRARCSQ